MYMCIYNTQPIYMQITLKQLESIIKSEAKFDWHFDSSAELLNNRLFQATGVVIWCRNPRKYT